MVRQAAAPRHIEREACAASLEREIERLSAPPFTGPGVGITRYPFTRPYMETLSYLSQHLHGLGFDVTLDPVGNLVARNRPPGVPVIGLGSHCDAVRGGGRYDGILGVLAAIEVARLSAEHGLNLPLQVISWVEEEAAGFGQMLLGSRAASGRIARRALREDVRAIDDGRSFYEHALQAGLQPQRAGEATKTLDGLCAWIELHIEQARVLEDGGERIGIVEAIAGYVHGDLQFLGEADHAGATPMPLRRDAALAAAESMLEIERLALESGDGAVATVGEVHVEPGVINAVPGATRVSLDIRAPVQRTIDEILSRALRQARSCAQERGLSVTYSERQRVAPVAMDEQVVEVLAEAVTASSARWRRMISGAAHDTMCVAAQVPSAMVFVPCRQGISHSPAESASAADAALAVEVMVNAAIKLDAAIGGECQPC